MKLHLYVGSSLGLAVSDSAHIEIPYDTKNSHPTHTEKLVYEGFEQPLLKQQIGF